VRRNDAVGTMVEEWEGQIDELAPLATTLESAGKEGRMVPVQPAQQGDRGGHARLWCISRDNKDRWRLEFNVREQQAADE